MHRLGLVLVFVGAASAFPPFPPPPFGFPPPPPPGPYGVPPGFDKVLPQAALEQLKAIQSDPKLSWEEKQDKKHQVLISQSDEVLANLPLPPGFDKIPKQYSDQLRALHMDRSLTAKQFHEKLHQFFSSIPEEIRRQMPPPPPPPGFDKLPKEVQERFRAVHEQKGLSHEERMQKIHEIMESLPEATRRLLPPPPPPPGFEFLPKETKEELKAIHEDRSLSWRERHFKIQEVIDALPENIRNKLPPPPPPPPSH